MHFEDWKELMKKRDLDSQLLWLIDSYDRYLRENRDKWESLRNASRVSDNYREAVDYNNREADAQRERYEWLLQYISENYICRSKLEKEIEELKAENRSLKMAMIFEPREENK